MTNYKHPRVIDKTSNEKHASDPKRWMSGMSRRGFAGGLLAGLAGLAACAASKNQKKTVSELTNHTCAGAPNSAPHNWTYSFEYRGVGTIIIRAKSKAGILGIVIPTVPARRKRAEETLDLSNTGKVDHLIVCVLHNHWDHAKHLQLFKEHLLTANGTAELIAAEGGGIKRLCSGSEEYKSERTVLTGLAMGSQVIDGSIFTKSVNYRLSFIAQGARHDGHAAHTGSGKACSQEKRHCGVRLLPSPRYTHCMVGELEIDEVRFTFFANDAASSYAAGALPAVYKSRDKKYDLAMIAIPDSHLAHGYPSNLINALNPDQVRWTHWEDFIFSPANSTRRIAKGKPPKTAGQSALPLHAVQNAVNMGVPSCFPQHGHIEYYPKP